MHSIKLNIRKTLYGKLFYSLFVFSLIIFLNGCQTSESLKFKETAPDNTFTISGKISIPEIIETDLAGSLRNALTTLKDFTKFKVSAEGVSAQVNKDGTFTIKNIPFSDKMVLRADANKLSLQLRVTESDLYFSDLTNVTINLRTTAEALIYNKGLEIEKNLTPGDIRAREYTNEINNLINAIKLVSQLPASSVSQTILELPAVSQPAKALAEKILEREAKLEDANSVLRNALFLKDTNLLRTYFSASFKNDWDNSSNYEDLISTFEDYFAQYTFENVAWDIIESEFLPDNIARIRARVTATIKDNISEETKEPITYSFDAYWRKEGTFWKLYKNFPYKSTHPKEAGANTSWGEIADIIKQLNDALATEDITIFENHISQSFTNDFDKSSSYTDLIMTAQIRFTEMDVKVSEYSLDRINFTSSDSNYADVVCSGRVKVYNLLPGVDIDSGTVSATVQWRKEGSTWKIFKNLPYKFAHKL
ncbi:MAG: hypothetical protein PHF29_05825 [Candidatus Riflebacteria bacterium]|nr:hypothetical protein [Candidatus Riflebacteria bacterium]